MFAGAVVAAGSELLGLAYLWGGISGWGVDCSGLVHLAHRVQGVAVSRDSVDQYAQFGPVQSAPIPGQPVFFRYRTDSHRIHHVGLAVSETLMLHAPKTGRVVEFLSIKAEPYGSELERVSKVV
jgi:cell wall-associated NlpC family hydrolase